MPPFGSDDWDRLGDDGKPRPLHIRASDGIDRLRPRAGQPDQTRGRADRRRRDAERLTRSPYFALERLGSSRRRPWDSDDRFTIAHGSGGLLRRRPSAANASVSTLVRRCCSRPLWDLARSHHEATPPF